MKFQEVISDIEKLYELNLQSIKKGAEITLHKVDRDNDRIELTTNTGKEKTRPLSEIQKVWEQLCKNQAVHVDKVLGGSGSSRNQPETILANLPYIEWFKFEAKKHIAFVGKHTHPYGTLKQMDEIRAEELREYLKANSQRGILSSGLFEVVIVTSDISQAAQDIEKITGVPVVPVKPGIYIHELGERKIWLASVNSLHGVKSGTYPVLKSTSIPAGSIPVDIDTNQYYAISNNGLSFMISIT